MASTSGPWTPVPFRRHGSAVRRGRARPQPGSGRSGRSFVRLAPFVPERTRLLPEAGSQVVFLFEDFAEYDAESWEKVMRKDEVGGGPGARVAPACRRPRLGGRHDRERLPRSPRRKRDRSPKGLPTASGRGDRLFSKPPPLFESITALGRDKTLERIDRYRRKLG